ncbi:hypothetical protein [Maridesulfovibrio ferrireducens]|uniref:hypothetical protein n=1 Tax=Maridesulfovibrio ferrireducens TaxID=246191 RepID=UPI001A256A3B|nr:hypothetical protein [Maridesulfovibrio ferrireducens]MBI9110144.1 hypothetical protein [Maridesulfovibrio ferrireducens]
MSKFTITLIISLILSIAAIQVQAAEINLGNDLTVKQDSSKKTSLMKDNIEKQFKPHDDVKISEGVSAGLLFEHNENTPKNNQRITPEKKGRDVGVGLSFSF